MISAKVISRKNKKQFMLFTLAICCAGYATLIVKADIDVKTTNIGFAALIAFASVCFSWVRTFEKPEEIKLRIRIRKIGETALFGAVNFLVASILKYTSSILLHHEVNDFFVESAKIVSVVFFILALLGLAIVMYQLYITILSKEEISRTI